MMSNDACEGGPGPIVVSGFGRCGSSLVMRILDAGGVPIICDPGNRGSSYETDLANSIVFWGGATEWLAKQHGQAIKLLSVHQRCWPPEFRFRMIWIDRDPREQAKSQATFLAEEVAGLAGNAGDRRAMAAQFRRSYSRDRARAFKVVRPRPILRLTFEQLIGRPEIAVAALVRFLDLDTALAPTMVSQVLRRSPRWSGSRNVERRLARLSKIDESPIWPLRERAEW